MFLHVSDDDQGRGEGHHQGHGGGGGHVQCSHRDQVRSDNIQGVPKNVPLLRSYK